MGGRTEGGGEELSLSEVDIDGAGDTEGWLVKRLPGKGCVIACLDMDRRPGRYVAVVKDRGKNRGDVPRSLICAAQQYSARATATCLRHSYISTAAPRRPSRTGFRPSSHAAPPRATTRKQQGTGKDVHSALQSFPDSRWTGRADKAGAKGVIGHMSIQQ